MRQLYGIRSFTRDRIYLSNLSINSVTILVASTTYVLLGSRLQYRYLTSNDFGVSDFGTNYKNILCLYQFNVFYQL